MKIKAFTIFIQYVSILTGTLLLACTNFSTLCAQTIFLNHSHAGSFTTSVNPALSLLYPEGNIAIIGRQQWVGMEGAPKAYWGSGHLGLTRLGAATGLQFGHESIGVERQTEVSLFFAKSIRLSQKDYIGLSLNAGLVHYDARYSGLDGVDQAFRQDINESDALLGMGAVFYRPDAFYMGISIPRFTSGGIGAFGDTRYNFENQYFLTGGFLLPLGQSFHLRPSLIVAHSTSIGTTVDGSAMIFARQIIGVGIGARTQGDLSGKLHINYSGFGIGYSYQFNPQNQPLNRHINNSTHEIGLSYSFNGKQRLL